MCNLMPAAAICVEMHTWQWGDMETEREVRSEQAKRKLESGHFDDNKLLVNIGASVRTLTLLPTVRQRQTLVETATKELKQMLM